MIKIIITDSISDTNREPDPQLVANQSATTPELAALRIDLEQLKQQLTDRTALFSEIITKQQEILDAIQLDTTKTAENHLLAQSLASMVQTLSEQMAQHLQQLQASK